MDFHLLLECTGAEGGARRGMGAVSRFAWAGGVPGWSPWCLWDPWRQTVGQLRFGHDFGLENANRFFEFGKVAFGV